MSVVANIDSPVLHVASILGLVSPLLHALPGIASTTGAILGATYYGILIYRDHQEQERKRRDHHPQGRKHPHA
jgi:hypothetical protein